MGLSRFLLFAFVVFFCASGSANQHPRQVERLLCEHLLANNLGYSGREFNRTVDRMLSEGQFRTERRLQDRDSRKVTGYDVSFDFRSEDLRLRSVEGTAQARKPASTDNDTGSIVLGSWQIGQIFLRSVQLGTEKPDGGTYELLEQIGRSLFDPAYYELRRYKKAQFSQRREFRALEDLLPDQGQKYYYNEPNNQSNFTVLSDVFLDPNPAQILNNLWRNKKIFRILARRIDEGSQATQNAFLVFTQDGHRLLLVFDEDTGGGGFK